MRELRERRTRRARRPPIVHLRSERNACRHASFRTGSTTPGRRSSAAPHGVTRCAVRSPMKSLIDRAMRREVVRSGFLSASRSSRCAPSEKPISRHSQRRCRKSRLPTLIPPTNRCVAAGGPGATSEPVGAGDLRKRHVRAAERQRADDGDRFAHHMSRRGQPGHRGPVLARRRQPDLRLRQGRCHPPRRRRAVPGNRRRAESRALAVRADQADQHHPRSRRGR